jgi:ParB family chromosome partitioning protein
LARSLRIPFGSRATASSSVLIVSCVVDPVEALTEDDAGRVIQIPPSHIGPNPDQPRHYFDKDALADLTESVRTRGVLQPISVRRDKSRDGYFILIAGERRWRAAKAAGLGKRFQRC